MRRVIGANITAREIVIKVANGKTFKLHYDPKQEQETVRYLAKQVGVNMAVVEEDTLANLLAEVKSQGMAEARATNLEIMGGRRGKLGTSVLE